VDVDLEDFPVQIVAQQTVLRFDSMYQERNISFHQIKNCLLTFCLSWFLLFILLFATSEAQGFNVILTITGFIAFIFTTIIGALKGFDW
jgi:hypothetical protein